jgi:hypothetical protein
MNTMTISHRKWQLPVAVADLQEMKFHNPHDPEDAGETTFDVNVGTTPFRLYCADRDPDQVLRHAVAGIQIFQSVFWNHPTQRTRQVIAFKVKGVGTFHVSANHDKKEINVFANSASHMTIELTSPLDWQDHGLGWLLEQPVAGEIKELINYLRNHPIGHRLVPVRAGKYISWDAALAHAGLQLDDGWNDD